MSTVLAVAGLLAIYVTLGVLIYRRNRRAWLAANAARRDEVGS